MKKTIAALAVLIGIVAFGSAVSAEQLPFEHCTWTKASGETVCHTVMPDGTIIPHDTIDSVEDALDINSNDYAYADTAAAADHIQVVPSYINGYALRAAVEAGERSLVWYERLDTIEKMLDITENPYAYELVPAATPADHTIEGNDYFFADQAVAL